MQFRNQQRREVDPVPFIVVALLGFAVAFSFGPGYLLELGLSLERALIVCASVTGLNTAIAYHRLVWTARPEFRDEIPAWMRLRRLLYVGLVLAGLLPLFALPIVL
jgi:hypothetical protein